MTTECMHLENDDWRMEGERRATKDRTKMIRGSDRASRNRKEVEKKDERKQDEAARYSNPFDNFYWNPAAMQRIL